MVHARKTLRPCLLDKPFALHALINKMLITKIDSL